MQGSQKEMEGTHTSLVVFLNNEAEERIREVIAERGHGRLELIKVNEAAPVLVKCLEASAPVLNVLPQSSKLGESNQTRVVYLANENCSQSRYS